MIEVSLSIPEWEEPAKKALLHFLSCKGEMEFDFLEKNQKVLSFVPIFSQDETFRFKGDENFSGIEFALLLQCLMNHYKVKTAITFFEIDKFQSQTFRHIVTRQQVISMNSSAFESCCEASDEELGIILCREFVTAYENLQRFKNDEDQVLKDILSYFQKRHSTNVFKKVFENSNA